MQPGADLALRMSVVVCTHNPRRAYLNTVIESLRLQSLEVGQWELLVVDNASTEPVAGWLDLAWHVHGRIVREEELGLTRARLRGINDTRAGLLVFVDDDNVLGPDYLQAALELAERQPRLGVWSGWVELEFEAPPPEWTRKYWPFLVHRPVERDETSQEMRLEEPLPVGAGMCVRREVAAAYATAARNSDLRLSLDRRGLELGSSGDTDLAMLACGLGWHRGVFKSLRVRHLIPPHRVTEDYLVRLVEGIHFSSFVVQLLHQINSVPPPINAWWHLKYGCDLAIKHGRQRRFFVAAKNAQRRSRRLYEELLLGEARSTPSLKPSAAPEVARSSGTAS
jgi:glycosyltransferase involved in cell wall biosynthesis